MTTGDSHPGAWRVPPGQREDFAWGLALALLARAGGEVTFSRAELAPALLGDGDGRWYSIEAVAGGMPGDELVTVRMVPATPDTPDSARGAR